jgi:hypothetical protein
MPSECAANTNPSWLGGAQDISLLGGCGTWPGQYLCGWFYCNTGTINTTSYCVQHDGGASATYACVPPPPGCTNGCGGCTMPGCGPCETLDGGGWRFACP